MRIAGIDRRVLGVLLAAAAACKSSSSTTDAPSGSAGGTITYEFDGGAHSGSILASATLGSDTAGGNNLAIDATDATAVLVIAVAPATTQATIATGTYAVADAAPLATFQLTVAAGSAGSAGSAAAGSATVWAANGSLGGSGSVVITALTASEITGTFEATLVDVDAATGSGSATGSAATAGSGMLANGTFDLVVNPE